MRSSIKTLLSSIFLFTCLVFGFGTDLSAQISGPTTAAKGTTVTYSYTGTAVVPKWEGNFTRISSSQSGSTYTIQVQWVAEGSSPIVFMDGSTTKATLNVLCYEAVPASPSVTDGKRCSPGTITLSTVPAQNFHQVRWYSAASGGNFFYTGNSYTTPSLSVTTVYYVAAFNVFSSLESAQRVPVTAYIGTIPSGATGSNVTVCSNASSIQLTATPGTGANSVRWYTASTGGTLVATGTTYAPPASTATYYISSFHTTTDCESTSARVAVTLTVNPAPGAPSTVAGARCAAGTVTLSASAGSGGASVRWYTNENAFLSSSNTFTTPSITNTTPYLVKSLAANGCESSPATLVLATINSLPDVVSATGASRCTPGSVTLTAALPASAQQIKWYGVTTGGTSLATGTSFPTPSISSSTTYYAAGYNTTTGCESAPRTSVTATIEAVPAAPATSNNSRFGAGTLALSASGAPAGGTYKWYSSSGQLLATASSYLTPQINASTTNYLYVTCVSAGGCESPITWVSINIYATPVITSPTPNVVMGSNVTLDAGAGYDSYTWRNTGGTTLANTRTYTTSIKDLYFVTVTKSGLSATAPPFNVGSQFSGVNMNYIVTNTILADGISVSSTVEDLPVEARNQTVQYFDGLGRPLETIVTRGSPSKKDIVQPVVYDATGRESVKYLPYVSGDDGRYKFDFISKENPSYFTNSSVSPHYQYYQSTPNVAMDDNPYAVTVFEPSPLSRIIKQGAPGTTWQPDNNNGYTSTDRTIKHSYEPNIASEVLIWTYTAPTTTYPFGIINTGTGTTPAYYAANQLYKNKTKDEQHNQVIEYIDRLGRTVLKRVQATTDANASTSDTNRDTNWASTYYVYDDFGSLVCVIPPEATRLLPTQYYQSGATDATKETFMQRWAFRYVYDGRKRLSQKQVPGAEPVYMVYDRRDRLAMTQDGNQRSVPGKKYWSFTKYDEFNRPVLTGIKEITRAATQAQMQASVDSFYNVVSSKLYEQYVGNVTNNILGYTNLSWPTTTLGTTVSADHYLTVNYYDTYTFTSLLTGSYGYVNEGLQQTIDGVTYTQPSSANTLVKGQQTGGRMKVLNSGATGGSTWLNSVTYFDDRYRPVQALSTNALGLMDRQTTLYDFVKAVQTKLVHNASGATGSHTVERKFNYDHAGRLKKVWHQLTVGTTPQGWVLLAMNEYNELGQLIDKKLHNTDSEATADASRVFKQSVDYRYNIRGWLNSINDLGVTEAGDFFGMNLNYNTPTANGGAAQFNGNISEILWKSADGQNQSYGYTYDPMNRLEEGKYYNATNTTRNNRFNEKIWDVAQNKSGYDQNGNIKYLQRQGKTGEASGVTTYGQMDNMAYTYSGNQLLRVTDTAVKTEGFLDGANTDDDYGYDVNGNMFADKNKSITAVTTANGSSKITYNHLNLVDKVVKSTGEYVKYIYDATGRKLSQIVYNASNVQQKRTDYAGEFVYEGTTGNTTLQFINHEEGRIIPGSPLEYQYHIKDHLGNVRVTFTTKLVTESPVATFEAANEIQELGNFLRPENVRKVQYYAFDHTNGGAPTTTTGYAERLSGGTNERYGLARSISVMPGDKITAEVFAKYIDPVSGNRTGALNSFLTQVASLISAGTTSSGTVKDGGQFSSSTSSFPFPTQAGSITAGSTESGPKAYLNWLVFDRDYNLILSKSNFDRLSATPKEIGQDVAHERLFSPEITIDVAGYVYIFLSNEETTPVDVYFDDFKVTQVKSPVVQMDDYYPFGLAFNSFSRENSLKQDFKYNGKELQDELSLGWLDYGARMYMADVGRWGAMDPLTEVYRRWGGYVYAVDNPLRYIDPNGMDVVSTTQGTTYSGADAQTMFIYLKLRAIVGEKEKQKETLAQKAFRTTVTKAVDKMNDLVNGRLAKETPDKNIVPGQVFYEWVKGTGPGGHIFDGNSYMGREMLRGPEIQNAISDIMDKVLFRNDCSAVGFSRDLKYEDEFDYVESFLKDVSGRNQTRALHGSFKGIITVSDVIIRDGKTVVMMNVRISDKLHARSGTRGSPSMGGYEKNNPTALYPNDNPYGECGQFRDIYIDYDMDIEVIRR
jgi:RHS repeat-associated protein